ncbi:MAG: class I SAM-dependent methyltransferase [Spirochaetales bacterium]|nr:class I SAM-dependent methyltransferase [Spirochaetales bacterium]
MNKSEVFDQYYNEYDQWFVKNKEIYEAEIESIRQLLPESLNGIEIGVGSGKFAEPLKIKIGVEPSAKMAELARKKGIEIKEGIAEDLPIASDSYDFALMVTAICFVDDPLKSFKELNRILKRGGSLIMAFVNKNSELGRSYQKNKEKSKFYKNAKFFSCEDIIDIANQTNFTLEDSRQTLMTIEGRMNSEKITKGYEEGAFVALKFSKN